AQEKNVSCSDFSLDEGIELFVVLKAHEKKEKRIGVQALELVPHPTHSIKVQMGMRYEYPCIRQPMQTTFGCLGYAWVVGHSFSPARCKASAKHDWNRLDA